MVDVYRTEEEQIEAIKKWWRNDGLSTIAIVVAVAVGYFGWQYWQGQQQQQSEALSDTYESLLVKVRESETDDKAKASAEGLIEELKATDSAYGVYAALIEAKFAVESAQLDDAVSALSWALEQKPEAAIADIASLRLARVLYANGDAQAALDALVFEDTSAWDVASYELQGDIYMSLEDAGKAVVAYEKANTLGEGTFAARYIEMKLNKAKATQKVVATNE